jgi:cephalosporin-C deacetylase
MALTLTSWAQPVLSPLKTSGIYALKETAGWRVTFGPATDVPAGGYAYTLKKNNSDLITSGKLDPANGPTTIATQVTEPAMLFLDVTVGEKHNAYGAAVEPAKLQPTAPRPADFDAFWDAKLKLLATVPVEAVITPGDAEKDGVDYATIRLNNINGAHVYGQLAKPKREGKFPALLILQWAGVYPLQKSWVVDRAAQGWLVLNIEPHDLPGDLPANFYTSLPTLIRNYNSIYNDDRDRNYFLQMYLGDYRAADYLASRPEWDGKIFVANGTSMGGQQSFALSGLHPKITHMITHVAAGADSNAGLHGRYPGYPNWDLNRPKVAETALYFDTVNFAPHIKAKSLVSMGFIDNVCPPAGIWTAFNQIPAPKEVVPLVDAAHNHQSTPEQQKAYLDRMEEWLTALVRGEEPKIAVGLTGFAAH